MDFGDAAANLEYLVTWANEVSEEFTAGTGRIESLLKLLVLLLIINLVINSLNTATSGLLMYNAYKSKTKLRTDSDGFDIEDKASSQSHRNSQNNSHLSLEHNNSSERLGKSSVMPVKQFQ